MKLYEDIWAKIGRVTPGLTNKQLIDNIRITMDERILSEGFQTFRKIKSIIDGTLADCSDIDSLSELIDNGPWNDFGLKYVQDNLCRLNEYTNTVGYLMHRVILRLAALDEDGIKAIQKLSAKNDGFNDYYYHVQGGNSQEVVSVGKVAEEIGSS